VTASLEGPAAPAAADAFPDMPLGGAAAVEAPGEVPSGVGGSAKAWL
jgi:hypothetical protein